MSDSVPPVPEKPKVKWYWTTRFLVIAVLSAGPFALPLLWFNKRYTAAEKLLWTIVIAGVSYYLTISTVAVFQKVLAQYRELGLIQ